MGDFQVSIEQGVPVVTRADQHTSIEAAMFDRAKAGQSGFLALRVFESEGTTYVSFGTTGRGLGVVTYRVVGRRDDIDFDAYELERAWPSLPERVRMMHEMDAQVPDGTVMISREDL